MDVDEVQCQNMDLIATTEDNIYILSCNYDLFGKHSFSYYCSSLDIKLSDILKLEIGNVYQFDHGREIKDQFVYIIKKDGKRIVFDSSGYDITDNDEYYEWEEHEWEVKDVIYDITLKEKKKKDNKSETTEHLNSADDLPF